MRYEKIMLSKNQLDYYQLFEKITKLPKRDYSLRQLAHLTGFSYAKVKYTLERIAEIVQLIDPEQAALFRQGKNLAVEQITISLNTFRGVLLKEHSIPFQFLLWLVKEESHEVADFLTENFISFSTLSRNIRELQNYLKHYGIQLSLASCTLVSNDELLLRQSLLYLFWMGTQGDPTLLAPYTIDESLLPKLLAYVPPEHRYVSEKLYRLKLIIQYFRLKGKHYHLETHRVQRLLEDNPLYDLSLCQNNPLIPKKFIAKESGGLLMSSLISPGFTTESALVEKHQLVLAKKLPTLNELVEAFLVYFESQIFKKSIAPEKRQVLQLNLLQAGAGIWAFQGSFPNLHYFLVQENRLNPASVHYEEEIRHFFRSTKDSKFLQYREYFPTFEKSFGHILKATYMEEMLWTKLRVAIAIEPNCILQEKLQLVIGAIYFVHYEPFLPEQADQYDLVITSMATFPQDFPDVPYLLWNIVTPDEELPYLFYTLRDLYYLRNERLHFM